MDVVIVESPAKAKTINKYLGSGYEVYASYGHVRDLPPKDGSVDPDDNFHMLWEIDAKAQKRLTEIAQAVKKADRLILATDPDREGEAISWHVLEVLKQKKALKSQPIQRVVFNAITKQAVTEAMKHPREIDSALVDAYLARRALDYLVGFTLSPVLWRKLPGSRSAGRVQSVALRLISERDREIEAFISQEYWSLIAALRTQKGEAFEARLIGADGEKITRLDIKDGATAQALKLALDSAVYEVVQTESKPTRRNPYPPFTTSTLQQEASRKLGFSASRTMQIAQKLYEGITIGGETVGLITYMRTDGVQIAGEAIQAVRKHIGNVHGDRYLPKSPRIYKTKAKNAQEAHEAIRPTDPARSPKEMSRYLDGDMAALYDLVWKRTIASQMEAAELERTTIDILAKSGARVLDLRANGSIMMFDGFLALYQESKDDDDGDDDNRRLPLMRTGDALKREDVKATQHFTEPPPHYTEASLVKRMEELGIGRPSTYAATLSVLNDRGYVRTEKKRLIGEDKGRIVTAFLENFFQKYVEYDFTAALEEKLDLISNNEANWRDVLRDFWLDFIAAINATKELRVAQVIDALNEALGPHIFPAREEGVDPRACPTCGTGQLSLKLSRYGSFIGCSNYPECKHTRPLDASAEADGGLQEGPQELGKDPETGEDVTLRDGRFGPYVQLGAGEKPKRSSLPKGWTAAAMDLDKALQLLSLPREVGKHPDTGEMILASIGRYGPYVQMDKTYANLDSVEEVFEVGLNRAVTVLAEKKEKGGRSRFGSAPAGRNLGDHPDGGAVTVRAGRFGPYVNHGKINATLPKGTDADAITLDEALLLLAAKAEAGGGIKKTTSKKATAKKTTAKADADAKPVKKKAQL
jgi:DNA topoisomerase-1